MLRKTLILTFVVFTVAGLFSFTEKPLVKKPEQKSPLKTIVIDAGHGGTDYGAAGKYSYEKDIALAISLRLEKLLHEEMPDVKVVMTRTTDIFDNVKIKAQKANEAKGDLFVCIHVNSAPKIRHSEQIGTRKVSYYVGKGKKRKKKTRIEPIYRVWYTPNPASGTETYIWAQDRSDEKGKEVLENNGEFYDNEEVKDVQLPDPNSPEARMAADIWVAKYFKKSNKLANLVQREFENAGRKNLGVKQRQKGIWVLQATAMPSILVETGFISNPDEEDYLNSENGQMEIAGSVMKALKQYKADLETQYIPAADSNKNNGNGTPKKK